MKKRKGEEASSPFFVRLIGLEPTRITTPDPKSGASTNFATSAIANCPAKVRLYFQLRNVLGEKSIIIALQ